MVDRKKGNTMFLYIATLVSGMEIEIITDGDPTRIAPDDVVDVVTVGEYTPAMDPWAMGK